MPDIPQRHFTQGDRFLIIDGVRPGDPTSGTFRKTARIIAVQIPVDFTVETDRGIMGAKAGDWLVTNHPDDDAGSDIWSISDERMQSTYEPT